MVGFGGVTPSSIDGELAAVAIVVVAVVAVAVAVDGFLKAGIGCIWKLAGGAVKVHGYNSDSRREVSSRGTLSQKRRGEESTPKSP